MTNYCGKKCTSNAVQRAPLILDVSATDPKFTDISSRFQKAWIAGTAPKVALVWKIMYSKQLADAYEDYRASVELAGNYTNLGFRLGNQQERWHGVTRECTVGDTSNDSSPCASNSCNLCNILKFSYDVARAGVGPFGKAIYANTLTSSANAYNDVPANATTPYRAVILSRVVAGEINLLSQGNTALTGPGAGNHSVSFSATAVGVDSDQLAVYDNHAIRAGWLVLYDK